MPTPRTTPKLFAAVFGLALLLVSAAAIEARRQPEPVRTESAGLAEANLAKTDAASAAPAGAAPASAPASATPASAQTAKPARPKFDEVKALADLRKEIAGKENQPAGQVFMDIDLMNGVTAAQLLDAMEKGYSRPLGVTCTHCHIPGEWQSNEKKEKEAARGMIQMTAKINGELLPKIKGLDTDHRPEVNCTTCHRGQVRPALRMP